MPISNYSLNSVNRYLLFTNILLGFIFYFLIFKSAEFEANIKANGYQLDELKSEVKDLLSSSDSIIAFNTKYGVVRIKKSDTILFLERRNTILIEELENKRHINQITLDKLVELKKNIIALRTEEIETFNEFNHQIIRSQDTMEFIRKRASIDQVGAKVNNLKKDINNLLSQKVKLTILHFRTLDKKKKEIYIANKVNYFQLDCIIQCLLYNQPIYLEFIDPTGSVIPFEKKITKLIKNKFPSVEDSLKVNGLYSKTIMTGTLAIPGDYEIIIYNSENYILNRKTIKLL